MFTKELLRLYRTSQEVSVTEIVSTMNHVGHEGKRARFNSLTKIITEGNCSPEDKKAISNLIENMDVKDPEIAGMIRDFHQALQKTSQSSETSEEINESEEWTLEELKEKEKLKGILIEKIFGVFMSSSLKHMSEQDFIPGTISPKILEVFIEEAFQRVPSLHSIIRQKMDGKILKITIIFQELDRVFQDFLHGKIRNLVDRVENGITHEENDFIRKLANVKHESFRKEGRKTLDGVLAETFNFCKENPNYLASDIEAFMNQLPSHFERNIFLIRLYEEGVLSDELAVRIIRIATGPSKNFEMFGDRRIFKFLQTVNFIEHHVKSLSENKLDELAAMYIAERERVDTFFTALKQQDPRARRENGKYFEKAFHARAHAEEKLRAHLVAPTKSAEERRNKDRVFKALFGLQLVERKEKAA